MQRIFATALLMARLRTPRLALIGLAGTLLAGLRLHGAAARAFRRGDRVTRETFPLLVDDVADWWEFLANAADAARGAPHHDDPLLAVRFRTARDRSKASGRGWVRLFGRTAPTGLRILAVIVGTPRDEIVLMADGRPVATLPIARSRRLPLLRSSLQLAVVTLQRSTVDRLPPRCTLAVSPHGPASAPAGGTVGHGLELTVPHGSGTLVSAHGSSRTGSAAGQRDIAWLPLIDKKGAPVPSVTDNTTLQQALAGLWADAAEVMRERLGKELFLLYGTLLGPVREGRFLPWDDDFDVAYFSEHTDVDDVRAESIEVMRTLATNGFTVGLNPQGRPFRLSDARGLGTLRLDVRPMWVMGGAVWAPSHARLPLTREQLVPCGSVTVDGRTFLVPADAEAFLAAYYGDDWREPRPGYRSPSRLTSEQVAVFERLRIHHDDVVAINAAWQAADPTESEGPAIHAFGTVPLYPLDVRARVMGV